MSPNLHFQTRRKKSANANGIIPLATKETLSPPPVEPPKERLDPSYVDDVFQNVENAEYPPYEGKGGYRPSRFRKIREVFRGKENENVLLSDFALAFEGHQNPRKYASNAIFDLNKALARHNLLLEVQTITFSGRNPAITVYRLRPWPHG